MQPPTEPLVAFGLGRGRAPGGVVVARAQYGGRPLRGEFVAGVAVRSACRRFLVLSQFHPIRTRDNVLLLLLAVVPWGVMLGTNWAPWLRTSELASLPIGLSMVLVLGVGFVLLRQLWARLRGRRLGSPQPYRLVLIDVTTGQVLVQRRSGGLLLPLRMSRVPRMMLPVRVSRRLRRYGRPWLISCQAASPDAAPTVVADASAFRPLTPAQAFR